MLSVEPFWYASIAKVSAAFIKLVPLRLEWVFSDSLTWSTAALLLWVSQRPSVARMAKSVQLTKQFIVNQPLEIQAMSLFKIQAEIIVSQKHA